MTQEEENNMCIKTTAYVHVIYLHPPPTSKPKTKEDLQITCRPNRPSGPDVLRPCETVDVGERPSRTEPLKVPVDP